MTATLTVKRRTIAKPYKPPATLSEDLARQMQQRALKLADDGVDQGMAKEDSDFLYAISRGQEASPADVARFAMLSDRAAGVPGNHKGNGHAKAETKPPKRETKVASSTSKASGGETVQILKLQLFDLYRHPVNRHPTKEAIAERAASMADKGQIEPIIVRPYAGGYQVLSGETRWLAADKLGWKDIEARIRECTDAQALELVAEANGQRQDLNPIERAQLIEHLCKPIDAGGAGLTKDAAALRVGLKDGSSASNLVRLLKLPKVWQDRVAAGELPESFARLICPYVHAPALMAEIEKDYQKAHKPKADEWERESWESRAGVERQIEDCLRGSRPVDDGLTTHYGTGEIKVPKGNDQNRYTGCFGRMFDLTPELEQQLGIVEHENIHFYRSQGKGSGYDKQGGVGKKTVRMATNVELYDKLNHPLIKAHVDQRTRGKAAKSGADPKPSKTELTPAERKALVKKQTEQLQARIDRWRYDWLRNLVAARIDTHPSLRYQLLILIALDDFGDNWHIRDAIQEAALAAAGHAKHGFAWEAILALRTDDQLDKVTSEIVRTALVSGRDDSPQLAIEPERIDELAGLLKIDVKKEWDALQDEHENKRLDGQACDCRFDLFFELFQTAQLDELGQELGVHVGDVSTKAAKIKILTTRDRTLKLPACIKPLGVPGKRKAKGRK